jgi:hypothetical protein
MGKRLGILGAVIAVVALVAELSAQLWDHRVTGLRRHHPATSASSKRSACLPCSRSLIQMS